MTKNLRIKTSKFIDETYKISFRFNGKTYFGYKGDTLASALLANDIHLVKSAPIPVGSQLQLIDGGAKIVLQSGDALKVQSSAASSVDVWVSAVDAISS